MDSDDDEDVPMVSISGRKMPINEVTDDMVTQMTPKEKETYIKLAQEMYQDMYE